MSVVVKLPPMCAFCPTFLFPDDRRQGVEGVPDHYLCSGCGKLNPVEAESPGEPTQEQQDLQRHREQFGGGM